ncbi:MAG TPA: nucleotidyltransferase family protein [Vicinamibacterales bacterium]|nr:nucleotidyltransferase family protein [Vicinamibacterales bacterium]
MSLPVAILAGGLATRLGDVTARRPKALVEIAGRPFAEHQIVLLRRHGIHEIVFLVGHLGEMVRDAIGDGTRWGIRVRYVFDGPRPLGTGGAIRNALPALGRRFFVLYGDSYLECDYLAVARAFAESGRPALMTVCLNDNRWDRSNVRFEAGRIAAYDKSGRTPGMRHIDYGLGVFTSEVFEAYDADRAFDLAAVYQDLLARGDLAGLDIPGRFYEIGSPAGLEETRIHLSGTLNRR